MKELKGFLIAISITFSITLVLYFSSLAFNDELLRSPDIAVLKASEQLSLNDDNIVDTLSTHVDTKYLKAVKYHAHVLEIDLLVDRNQSAQQFIYEQLPQYIALAFVETNNVEQLKLRVLEEQGVMNNKVSIFSSHLYRNDAWLISGISPLLEETWLEDYHWRQRLRINTTIYWQ